MRNLGDVTNRLAGAALVAAGNGSAEGLCGPRSRQGRPEGMEQRGKASGRVLGRRIESVGYRGVRMSWKVEGDGEKAVEEDAKRLSKLLGTAGVLPTSLVVDGRHVSGRMPWLHGQGNMTWDDVHEILRDEGLL